MIKNYTQEEYNKKVDEANAQGKKLYILVENDIGNLVIADDGYYICYQANLTDGTINENLPQEQAEERENDFKTKFFNIKGYGWFRKHPKGYQSAVECLNLAFNNVSIIGKLPANTLIFYAQPDFTNPEECTEEWLIEHQTTNEEMTAQEFGTFYAQFSVAWNTAEHE